MGFFKLPRGSTSSILALSNEEAAVYYDTEKKSLVLDDGASKKTLPDGLHYEFHANLSSTGSYDNVNIVFDDVQIASPHYNPNTGVYTVPVSGLYWFNASVIRNAGFNNSGLSPFISRNGNYVVGNYAAYNEQETPGSDHYLQVGFSTIIAANQGDAISVHNAGNPELMGSTAEPRTFFQGYKI